MRHLIDLMESLLDPVRAGGEQTLSPEFQRWFAGSKVVTDDGLPMLMFHGTVSDIEQFDPEKITLDDPDAPFNGFWFSSDCETSPAWCNPTNIMPLFLSIKNPADWKAWRAATQAVRKDRVIRPEARSEGDEVRMRLIDQGYDGVCWEKAPTIDHDAFHRDGRYDFRDARGTKHWIERGKRPEVEWKDVPETFEEVYLNDGSDIQKCRAESSAVLSAILKMLDWGRKDEIKIDWSDYDMDAMEGTVRRGDKEVRVKKMARTVMRNTMVNTGKEFDTVELYNNHIGHIIGYDDLADFLDSDKHQVWVAFHPAQIKSAYNRGTWDSNSKNISEDADD